jgi:hypothetical protein
MPKLETRTPRGSAHELGILLYPRWLLEEVADLRAERAPYAGEHAKRRVSKVALHLAQHADGHAGGGCELLQRHVLLASEPPNHGPDARRRILADFVCALRRMPLLCCLLRHERPILRQLLKPCSIFRISGLHRAVHPDDVDQSTGSCGVF